jgi:hypothetical protein
MVQSELPILVLFYDQAGTHLLATKGNQGDPNAAISAFGNAWSVQPTKRHRSADEGCVVPSPAHDVRPAMSQTRRQEFDNG